MKSQDEILRRLNKLRSRYLRKHCLLARGKKPDNCVFNHEHTPQPRKAEIPAEFERAPRTVTSLVVIQPDQKIRLCMYGADNPAEWPGDICDSDEMAQGCRFFQSKSTEAETIGEFNALMADDKYVYDNYKDIAALQWVIDHRIHLDRLSVWSKLLRWIDSVKHRLHKPKLLSGKVEQDIPGDLW